MKRLFALLLGAVLILGGLSVAEAQPQKYKMAVVMAAPIQDADYGTLAYETINFLKKKYGIQTAYAEKAQVPETERILREYIDEGFNIIWLHGAQFTPPALKIAAEYPNVVFIAEEDIIPKTIPPNFWYMDRNYYIGFYPLGYLAALKTQTGKIGYIGGLDLPFARGEINAIKQAIRDSGVKAEFDYLFVGDFNDVLKARQATEGLIAKGVDVIISALNMGNFGMFPAVMQAKKPVYVATTYTDKKSLAPGMYLTSDLFDFKIPLDHMVGRIIKDGTKTGVVPLEYGPEKAIWTQFPIQNVTDAINAKVKKLADDIVAGKIKVIKKLDKIE
jgi:basic membrane protein A and related proteins